MYKFLGKMVVMAIVGLVIGLCAWVVSITYKKLLSAAITRRKAAIKAYNRPPKLGKTDIVTYEVPVAGVTQPGRQELISGLMPTDDISFEVVDGYVADKQAYPNAVGVFVYDHGVFKQLGWIPDDRGPKRTNLALMFRDKMRKGKDPVITGWHKVGGTENYPKLGMRLEITNPK